MYLKYNMDIFMIFISLLILKRKISYFIKYSYILNFYKKYYILMKINLKIFKKNFFMFLYIHINALHSFFFFFY